MVIGFRKNYETFRRKFGSHVKGFRSRWHLNKCATCPTIVGVWENYKLYLSRGVPPATWHRNVPSNITSDDHEVVNEIWGAGSPGRRDRRAVFRDIGTEAWYDYLGCANPVDSGHPIHSGRAMMRAGSDLLVGPEANFEALPLEEMSNLHVHWGTPTAGVNEISLNTQAGDPNAGVYEIKEVVNPTTLLLHQPVIFSTAIGLLDRQTQLWEVSRL